MNDSPPEDERNRRQRVWAEARAMGLLEGREPSPELTALAARYVEGELTAAEVVAEVRRQRDRTH